jgi:CMP-N,N'-diacetyllegionaminic acid synthase
MGERRMTDDPAVRPCLAIVPARGGSKGLPDKNIRPLCGLPLIAHSLRCAQLASCIDEVIVSTDSEEIAAVARAHGGQVPFLRPRELALDHTPMMPVLSHALEWMERQAGISYRSVLLLDPTSPGRTPDDIERAVSLLSNDRRAMGAVACSRPTFNPFWVGVVERDGYLASAFEGGDRYERRQDVPPFFRINGALYLWRAEHVRGAPENWRDAPHLLLEIPERRAFSIDDLYELELADLLLRGGLVRLPWLAEGP